MDCCASKKSSNASTPREESEKLVLLAVEPTSKPVPNPIVESKPASESLSKPIPALTEAANEAQTNVKVSKVKYYGFNQGEPDQSEYFKPKNETIQVETKQKSEERKAIDGREGDVSKAIGMFRV